MSSSYTFKELLDSVYDRVDDMSVIGRSLDDVSEKLHQLDGVQSCVAIGAGYGRLEMLFLKHCMPNLTEFTAVEPDAASIVEIKKTFAQNLPTVRSVFCQETVQSWQGVDKSVDAVFLIHFLYYLNAEEQTALFRRLLDDVLHSGSYVFVLTHPHHTSGEPSAYLRLVRMVGSGTKQDAVTDGSVREAMAAVGFELCYERMYTCHLNVEDVDDTFLSLLLAQVTDWSFESARRAATEIFGDAKHVRHDSWLGVFRKP